MTNLSPQIQADIKAISSISVVPTILDMVCHTTGMGFSAVARVTDTQWVCCSVHDKINFGIKPGGELKLETTICHEIRQSGDGVIIDHVALDPYFSTHHTPAMYGFQSYISIPIFLKDGRFFGTLCAIDPNPHKLSNPETINMFKLYAELIAFHLHAIDELVEERRIADLREQFIAILGHDLRNPISAISTSSQLLLRSAADDRTKRLAGIIKDSSVRMAALVENVMDFASARLGGGLTLKQNPEDDIAKVLNHVIEELQIINPDCVIKTDVNLAQPVNADSKRIAQLFSNLLANALTHGKAGTPVKVKAISENDVFELSITNFGEPIAVDVLPHLFHPFARGDIKKGDEGLGLGLFISQQIAEAHGGKIAVISTEKETSFTFSMPLN
ncbi:HAMP domain-containing histidine kinase [Mucilaginibacter sp. HMF5004]|uniref:GAF domain-containing sensor histidine kinase n=1 Tax=Mucilaginibacter rivuli TaxID=2857527 RepID=UPI001C5D0463|nr:HAMP domain-containing sensor histidine kinase [Mucilaginibacter rivuli]MBW4890020.1 HAMP domain-containing histidine kinase [Mucilaginibacter rivuli]